jgi:hypothetical protein
MNDNRIVRDADVEEAISYLTANADAAAKAIAEVAFLENFRQSLKAQLMCQSDEKSAAAQERDAYAHPSYVEFLNGLRAATEIAERHKFMLSAKRAVISAWQTKMATQRALGEFQ